MHVFWSNLVNCFVQETCDSIDISENDEINICRAFETFVNSRSASHLLGVPELSIKKLHEYVRTSTRTHSDNYALFEKALVFCRGDNRKSNFESLLLGLGFEIDKSTKAGDYNQPYHFQFVPCTRIWKIKPPLYLILNLINTLVNFYTVVIVAIFTTVAH